MRLFVPYPSESDGHNGVKKSWFNFVPYFAGNFRLWNDIKLVTRESFSYKNNTKRHFNRLNRNGIHLELQMFIL